MIYTAEIVGELLPDSELKYGNRIGVFRIDGDQKEQIGEYERNYKSFFNTFFHFRQNGKDLALYSPDYTVTRIMELPACRDLGGEEPGPEGFSPTDYFVPTYIAQEITSETSGSKGTKGKNIWKRIVNKLEEKVLSEFVTKTPLTDHATGDDAENVATFRPLTPRLYYPFGFVAGCVPGDDSAWKIQYLDLSEAEEGIVKRDDRFGQIVLPENQRLMDAVDMNDYGWDKEDESANYIRISVLQTFDLTTGKKIE